MKLFKVISKEERENTKVSYPKSFSFEEVICAGDSEFDISMLNTADCALCPEQLKEYIRSENCISFDTEKQNFAEQILNYVLTERRGNI